MNFIIYCPWQTTFYGGVLALHKLCKDLCDLGHTVYMQVDCTYECNSKIYTGILPEGTIAIYPEIVDGNPYDCEHVVRWIMYHTKPEKEATWADTDMLFLYNPSFVTSRVSQVSGVMAAYDFGLDFFKDQGFSRLGKATLGRGDKAHGDKDLRLIGKGYADVWPIAQQGREAVRYFMNKIEVFETHDEFTYFSVIAALCGARSIIHTEKEPLAYIASNPMMGHGIDIAGKVNGQDVVVVNRDKQALIDFLRAKEEWSLQSIKNFCKYLEDVSC